jgi:hypothetical protein
VKKLLGKVDLRNTYAVYEQDGAYTVASENPRGQRYECRVPPEAVSYLCRRLNGQRVTAEQAGKAIEPAAERFELPYTYELIDWIVYRLYGLTEEISVVKASTKGA